MSKLFILKKIFKTLKKTENINGFYFVIFLVVLGIFFELIGVGLIPAIVVAILNPDLVETYISNYFQTDIFKKQNIIYYLISIFAFVYILKTLISIYIYKKKWAYVTEIREKFTYKIFNFYINNNYNFFVENNSAYLIRNTFTEVIQLTYNFLIPIIILCSESLTLLFILSLLIIVEAKITLIVLIGFFLAFGVFYLFSKETLKRDGNIRQEYEGIVLKHLQSSFHSIKEIKTFSLEKLFSSVFKNKNKVLTEISERFLFINSIPRLWFELVLIISVVIVLISLLNSNSDVIKINATLGLYLAAILRIMPSLNRIAVSYTQIGFSIPAVNKVCDLIFETEYQKIKSTKNKIKDFQKINIKNVSYKFPKQENFFIENLNFEINKNDKIAIIGETGSGKSTILNLIIGLIHFNKGEFLIDEKKINDDQTYLNLIGYVPQNIYLFDETIRKNITIGIEEDNFSQECFDNAISLSLSKDFINKLKNQENTVVGEKAVKLSGGQAQRLGLARALYRLPKILVLDEGTSALDLNTENLILDNLFNYKKNLTIIYVTHRKENLKRFDRIIEVKNGKIFENQKKK